MRRNLLTLFAVLFGMASTAIAQSPAISLAPGVLDETNTNTMGLSKPAGLQTITVFQPTATTDHYSNGVVLAAFKGKMYCMWQSDPKNEDYPQTWTAYSVSSDNGATWSAPDTLGVADKELKSKGMFVSSGGWLVTKDSLVAFLNYQASDARLRMYKLRRYVAYRASADGQNWTEPRPVLMENGDTLNGIFEQDPRTLSNGRILGAAHFWTSDVITAKDLLPIYTDDPTGTRGWKKAKFNYTDKTSNSREMEPSWFLRGDSIIMVMRDQNSTYKKLVSYSLDNGETWSDAVETNIPDCRAKQSAGNLPDGRAFLASCTSNDKSRWPLTLLISDDGSTFTYGYLLRSHDELPSRKWNGNAKTVGYSYPKSIVYDNALWIAFSQNKEEVLIAKVPLSSIVNGIEDITVDKNSKSATGRFANATFNISGQRVSDSYKGLVIKNGKKFIQR